jgi:CRISPR-associated protein Csm3
MKIKELKGTLLLKTGLHIGSGDTEMHIGGVDSQVVKHPQTLQPYIPGSSLKGKIRSLLELFLGLTAATVDKNGKTGAVFQSSHLDNVEKLLGGNKKQEAVNFLKLFGNGAGETKNAKDGGNNYADEIGITRLSFRDCFIKDSFARPQDKTKTIFLTEVKSENTINRMNSTAANPRFFERVPAGIEFDFNLAIKELDGDNSEEMLAIVKKGLKLLELDALGGSGSRGYGRVEFKDLSLDGTEFVLPPAEEIFNQ